MEDVMMGARVIQKCTSETGTWRGVSRGNGRLVAVASWLLTRPIACTGKTGPHSLPLRRPTPPGATYELAETVQPSGATSLQLLDLYE
jgi:hypothetical protein